MRVDQSTHEETLKITVSDDRSVTAVRTAPNGNSNGWLFFYAPGAGSNINDPFGRYACRFLSARGYVSVRFQFPYKEEGRRAPDRPPVLEATWREVLATQRHARLKIVIGGRSMGGRIASQVVAKGATVDALVLFAYPLHPPGDPTRWRDKHLPAIKVPTLFCPGTRDAFAEPDELRMAASKVPESSLHLLEGADHGFGVLKSSGRKREDVWEEATGALEGWIRSC